MRYLFGDSTESSLDFDYLAFLREVVDCAVVMVECDVALSAIGERKKTRERETETQLAAVAELGKHAAELVGSAAAKHSESAVSRCAAVIATAIKDAVERESAEARTKLAAEGEDRTKESRGVNARAKEALEKLMRTHDLPGAEKEVEVRWTTGTGVKATMRQRTSFGVEAVVAMEIPASSVFMTPDLRVDRVAEGIEVHAREAGGWLKKSDKLVAHKLGRYHVVSVTVGANVRVQLRGDANGGDVTITAPPGGEVSIESSGGNPARELTIEERDRAGLRSLTEKLGAATRSLSDAGGSLVSIEIDGKSMTEQANPRVLAERLTAAIAPTVQKIKLHSRSPGELVLRRLIADGRREELFVSIADLRQKIDTLPMHARSLFAPLQLQGEVGTEQPRAPIEVKPVEPKPLEVKPAVKPADAKPVEVKQVEVKPADVTPVKPVEVKPVEVKPLEVKPVEVKPVEVKPPPAQDLDDEGWPIPKGGADDAPSDKGLPPSVK